MVNVKRKGVLGDAEETVEEHRSTHHPRSWLEF